jgi:hypothetical protein
MKLLFQLDDQVHTFGVTETLNGQDLLILKDSLFRFFDSHPAFTIIDLSLANLSVPTAELDQILVEINNFAQARGLNLVIARTEVQAVSGKEKVLERALQKHLELLQAKVEIREKMRGQAALLVAENAELKESMNLQFEKLKALRNDQNPLSPLLEKLWNEK